MILEKKFDDGFIIRWNINFDGKIENDDKCPNCHRKHCEWWFGDDKCQ